MKCHCVTDEMFDYLLFSMLVSSLVLLLFHYPLLACFCQSTPCFLKSLIAYVPMAVQIETNYIPVFVIVHFHCFCLFHCHCHCKLRVAISLIVCPRNLSKSSPAPTFIFHPRSSSIGFIPLLLQHPLAL